MTAWRNSIVAFALFTTAAWGPPRAAAQEADPGWPSGVLYGQSTNSSEAVLLPLKATDVQLRLIAGILSATVSQTFVNPTDDALEAVYLFPLPARAAVTDMELRIGERLIRSVVKEKDEARETYETARREGRAAALLEAERPNLFRTSVANFMPGEEAVITFTYTEPAPIRDGVYAVTFPMVAGQRYFPTNAHPPAATAALNSPTLPADADPGHRVALELETYGLDIGHIVCHTHPVAVEPIPGIARAFRISPTAGPLVADRDFSISLEPTAQTDPVFSWVVFEEEEALYGMATLFPPALPETAVAESRDVVFLIDTSGSMMGDSIKQAAAGLEACLRSLRPDDRFAIVRFSHDFSSFDPALLTALPDNVERACAYVRELAADGGTEMQPALAHGLGLLADSPRLPLVVFLTDGDVGNEYALMQLLDSRLGRARLFSFGIGSAPNEFLMNKLAQVGRGQTRFIRSTEDIGEAMSDFFRTLDSPVLTDVRVSWLDPFGRPLSTAAVYPSPCPDVFIDRPLQLVGEFRDAPPASVLVEGRLLGAHRQFRFTLDRKPFRHTLVGRLYGQARVDDLMTRLHLASSQEEKKALRAEVVETALRHQLVTPFTSCVAVEERIVRAPDGTLRSIPVATPTPYNGLGFAATATQDILWLALGLACLLAALFAFLTERFARAKA